MTVQIKKILKPWMQVNTWHTGHPLDDRRFHKSISELVIDVDLKYLNRSSIESAMHSLVDDLKISFDEEFLKEHIEKYVQKAETIIYYLHDANSKGE